MTEKKFLNLEGLASFNEKLRQCFGYINAKKADVDSPSLTGTPTAPTPLLDDNSTRIATTQYVNKAIQDVVAPEDNGGMTDDMKKANLKYYRYLENNSATSEYGADMRKAALQMEEFSKLGSGMFIHWGVYSVPAGTYTGTKVATATMSTTKLTRNVEWSLRDLGIPLDVYRNYENQFTGENFDPEAICQIAEDCGMKYIIVTAKHHEGFSLYPTEYGQWDITTSACRNTVLDELKAACENHGLKFCVYYSQYWDWEAVGGFGLNHGNKWTTSDPYTQEQHTTYCNNTVKQINEIVERYEPYVLWYDPGTAYDSYLSIYRDAESKYYPHVITNDRLAYDRRYGDYGTGERTIYTRNKLSSGESCFTLNNTWGYSANNETESWYYSLETIMKQFMLYTVSYGQNCILNVGPKADGSLPALTISRLNSVKSFINDYACGGFSGYTRASSYSRPKWGYLIGFPDNKMMCYVIPKDNTGYDDIVIDGIDTTGLAANGVNILTNANGNAAYEIIDDYSIRVTGMTLDSASKIGVVELNYSSEPTILDATTAKFNEDIAARVVPIDKTALTYDFSTQYITLPANKEYTTRFIWNDDTQDVGINLAGIPASGKNDMTTTWKITDIKTGVSQTISAVSNAMTTSDTVNLVRGRKYDLSLKLTGTMAGSLTMQSFKFTNPIGLAVSGITIDKTAASANVGETVQLTATVSPANAENKTVTWSASNANASVDANGLVTCNSAGTCIITATTNDGGFTATCEITISAVSVDSISLSDDSLTLSLGDTHQLEATVSPSNATDKSITWSTTDDTIATVSADGLVTVSSTNVGTCNIVATSADGLKSATCSVVVSDAKVTGVSLDKHTEILATGETVQLTATVEPDDASNKNISWTSSNNDVATVSNDGLVTAVSVAGGTCTITVTTENGNFTDTCDVTVVPIAVTGVSLDVNELSLTNGATRQLIHTVAPANAANKNVTWSSSDNTIATVNNGLVEIVGLNGSCTITVTTEDGNFTDTCSVSVATVPVTNVELDSTSLNLIECQTASLTATVTPENATDNTITWTTSDSNIAAIDTDGNVTIPEGSNGTCTITATANGGNVFATCAVTTELEHTDYLFEADSLDGSEDQGINTGITLFDDDHQNWTLFGYAKNSKNDGQNDNNATLYQIVRNQSAWYGLRVDADNNNYPRTTAAYSPLIPRTNITGENYINTLTGVSTTGKPKIDPSIAPHPVCFSRSGDIYKYSIDGINWNALNGVSASTISSTLTAAPLTIATDYRRSSGTMTDTKYRKLITDEPCCVAINYTSEYPFPKKYKQYGPTTA